MSSYVLKIVISTNYDYGYEALLGLFFFCINGSVFSFLTSF